MAGIYAADIYCDDCIDDIKNRIARELFNGNDDSCMMGHIEFNGDTSYADIVYQLDHLDERTYDSGCCPKYCGDDEESDVPEHCGSHADCLNPTLLSDGSKVGYCFGNSLTSEGEENLKKMVRDGGLVAELWRKVYDWVDFPNKCENCGDDCTDDLCGTCEESQCVGCSEITVLNDNGECYDCTTLVSCGNCGVDSHPDGCENCDEPCEGDFTITPCGPLGGKIGVGRVEGKFVDEFNSYDEAIMAIRRIMNDEKFWPNVWLVSDHGNWSLYVD